MPTYFELVHEHVVIHCIANCAAQDTNSEGEGSNGGDEFIRTNDCGDDRGGDDDAADTETGNDEDGVHDVEIVFVESGHGATA